MDGSWRSDWSSAAAVPAQAQQRTGSTVSGSVVDESGAILPGANVQIQGPA
jgi:hypothetical protein